MAEHTSFAALATLPIDPTAFRRGLAARMAGLGISQRELAFAAGMNHSTVSRILSGRNEPTLVTAVRLARALTPERWRG